MIKLRVAALAVVAVLYIGPRRSAPRPYTDSW